MIVGFTGTREGMTKAQEKTLTNFLLRLKPSIREFHHGDCIGADAEAHVIVRTISREIRIVIHPPRNSAYRAFMDGDASVEREEYLYRNRNIVNSCELLIVAPNTGFSSRGTRYTFNFAIKSNKEIRIIYSNGEMESKSK